MCPSDNEVPTPDRVLSAAEVLAIVRKHTAAARELTGVDESGRKGRAYFVDDGIVLKTHRPQRLRGRMVEEFETCLEKEALFLAEIEADRRIPAPRPLGWGHACGVDYVLMTRVDGLPLRRAGVDPATRQTALHNLGSALARIHSLPQAALKASALFPSDESAPALKERMTGLLGRMADAVNSLPAEARPSQDAREWAARAAALLPPDLEPVALHSNPAAEHVYVDPATGGLAGLIDFGDAYISHPGFDLRPWRGREERRALLAGYAEIAAVDAAFLAAMKAAMVLGELAVITRQRQPVAESEAILSDLLESED